MVAYGCLFSGFRYICNTFTQVAHTEILYCSMCSDLNSRLQSLRLSHLSHTALEQFKKVELENLQDGFEGYDLLIMNFDFDSMWFHSLKVVPLEPDNYQVTYQAGKYTHQINI